MMTKIKYTFINGDVLEVEADDAIATYILRDRVREASSKRKEQRRNYRIQLMNCEDERFASQWGNPERILLEREGYESLSKKLDELTAVQQRRLILRLAGLSCREIARQERVSVQSVSESIEGVRKKLLHYLNQNSNKE